jgi:hypothetical protein
MQIPRPVLLIIAMAGLFLAAGCMGTGGGTTGGGSTPATARVTTAPGPVVIADAYPPAEPYEIDPRFVRNTPQYRVDPALFTEVYHDRFTMNYNSVGLLVTVDKAPVVIDFSVTPGSRDPVYSFFILTVRDGDSRQVVGQEGYGRTFSTDSPKRLVFTSPGKIHLNLYGNMADVELHIFMKK